jgi:NAD(P)-dependent dehydrogenase (short-subunit alcohol dehydrogenase family)
MSRRKLRSHRGGSGIVRALIEAGTRVVLAHWDAGPSSSSPAENAFGPVEILVSDVGVSPDWNEPFDVPEELFDRSIAIMLTGVFSGIRAFAGGMRELGEGHIVNTASMNRLVAVPRGGLYRSQVWHRGNKRGNSLGDGILSRRCLRAVPAASCPTSVRAARAGTSSRVQRSGHRPQGRREDVVDAIRENDLYVITHREYRPAVARRGGGGTGESDAWREAATKCLRQENGSHGPS